MNVGGIGSVIVNLSDAPVTVGGITVAASSARDGFGDTDTLTGFERARGTDKNDALFGSAGNNRLDGMGGVDTLDGGAGFDEAFINLFDVIGGPLTSSVVNGEVFVRAGSVEVLKISQSAGVITTTGLGPAAFYGVDTLQNIEAVSISNDGSFLQVPVSLLTPINAGIDQNGNGFITGTAANDVLDVAIALPGLQEPPSASTALPATIICATATRTGPSTEAVATTRSTAAPARAISPTIAAMPQPEAQRA